MDLQPVIIEYLCRQRTLSLPGLGTLRWLEHKPERSSDLIFKGPTFGLHHSSKEGSPSDFADYLSRKTNVSSAHASAIVAEWTRSVLEQVRNAKEVRITGLGAFYEKDGRVCFKADQIALQQGGDLTLTIASRDLTRSVKRVEETSNGSNFRLWDILLPLILIALIALLSVYIWKSFQPDGPQAVDTVTAVGEVEEPVGEDEVVDDTTGQAAAEDSSNYEAGQGTEGVDDHDSPRSEERMEEETEVEEEEGYIEESVENGEEQKIVSRAKEGECIVIIGSFKRNDFADLAVQRVLDRGLRAYTETYGDFTRVGVVFDCETQDLYRRLFQLRGDFGEDAWILKYK
jgi:cell division septation protein DedD